MCPAVLLTSTAAISYGAMALLVKKMNQVEIKLTLLLLDYIAVCYAFPFVSETSIQHEDLGKETGKWQWSLFMSA